jgi:hypothetical protein
VWSLQGSEKNFYRADFPGILGRSDFARLGISGVFGHG